MTKKAQNVVIALIGALILSVGIPQSYSLVVGLKAKSHVASGCEAFVSGNQELGFTKAQFSRAALLNPLYIPLAVAASETILSWEEVEGTPFQARWQAAIRVLQGVCDNYLNPQLL